MRDFKFRAWDSEEKRFFFVHIGDNSIRYPENYTAYYTLPGAIRFTYAEGWQQYTGLKDKNGKECYHKDIVESEFYGIGIIEHGEFDCGNSDEKQYGFYLKFDNICFGIHTITDDEIIGNIYENPELLTTVK